MPPPVNRAGKPKIPNKPSALAKKPDALAAPEPSAEVNDHGVSPFNTPPNSGKSTPAKERNLSNASRARNDSDASFDSAIQDRLGCLFR